MFPPMTCLCCGAKWHYEPCVIGFRCDCTHGIDNWCFLCNKCSVHCKCKDGIKSIEWIIENEKKLEVDKDNKIVYKDSKEG